MDLYQKADGQSQSETGAVPAAKLFTVGPAELILRARLAAG